MSMIPKHDFDLLRNTIDSSMDMIQVFQSVRNEANEIIDFIWILNNKTSEDIYGDVIGKSLVTLNSGVIQEGIFDTFVKVVETGVPNQSIIKYHHEQFNGWYHQSAVKQGDGVTTTTKDITLLKETEEKLLNLEKQKNREAYELSVNAVEQERNRIAESLHNGVGQILYGVKVNLMTAKVIRDSEKYNELLDYTETLLGDAINETRRISHELVPFSLKKYGLKYAISEICKQFSSIILFKIKTIGNLNILSEQFNLIIYRIAQELITNTVNHSQASICNIYLKSSKNEVILSISDNGIGKYSPDSTNSGLRLSLIYNKIKLLNGVLNIKSSSETGTKVKINIPLN